MHDRHGLASRIASAVHGLERHLRRLVQRIAHSMRLSRRIDGVLGSSLQRRSISEACIGM
jgi:hypothetical protein